MRRLLPAGFTLWLVFGLQAVLALSSSASAAEDLGAPDSRWGRITEITLPNFQRTAVSKDLPVVDLRFSEDDTLMLLGRTSLWRWSVGERSLRRLDLSSAVSAKLNLGADAASEPTWQALGSDGLHMYVAGRSGLVQIGWEENRLYRLRWPKALAASHFLGFAGQGDDFWLMPASGLIHFDRYGKTFGQSYPTPFLHGDEHLAFIPADKRLWFTQGKKIRRLDLTNLAAGPVTLLKVKHELLDLQPFGAEMITHTNHTVLRLGQDGKIRRSIPVEGSRRLLAMSISQAAHVYAFDDQMLEVFYPQDQRAERFRLPLEDHEEATKLQVRGRFIAVLVNGQARLFRLDTTAGKR